MRYFPRNNERTEHDDFVLNVAPYMQEYEEATPRYNDEMVTVGWTVKPKYE